jgi:hypothetical protein
MLNRAGKAAGIDERSLFTGPESRARRYASEELLNHWQSHPRPTSAYFAGKDTTLGPQNTAPRRKRRGVGPTYRPIRPPRGRRGPGIEVAVVRKDGAGRRDRVRALWRFRSLLSAPLRPVGASHRSGRPVRGLR